MIVTTRLLKIAAPLVVLAGLSACAAPGFRTEVSRFNALSAPGAAPGAMAVQGQSFAITSDDPALAGGLEFGQYANVLTAEMVAEGFVPAASADSADLLVTMSYDIDKGEQKFYRDYDPFYFGVGFGGYGRGGFGRPFGYGRHRRGFYSFGWNDPWLFGPNRIDSVTIYTTELNVRIDRRADNMRLFEGKAAARSTTKSLPKIVPNLVTAMFTDFPGNNGETVKITVAPERE